MALQAEVPPNGRESSPGIGQRALALHPKFGHSQRASELCRET